MANKEISRWQRLDSQYLIRRPWLTARRDTVYNPSTGVTNDEYYVLEYPDWVNVLAITPDERFVMVRQYRYALDVVETELCAGVIEQGETPLEAAQRELREETGYGGGDWREVMAIGQNPGSCNNLTHCFLATGVTHQGDQRLDRTEDIAVELLTRDELLSLMRSGELHQAMMLAPLYRYFLDNQ